jgi:hypothetical protein
MKKLTLAGVVSLCFLSVCAVAKAQMGRMPAPQGIFNPVVGSGAQYEMDRADGSKMNFVMAIVGKESSGGKDGFWFETTVDAPQGQGEMVMKMLIVPDGANSQVTKMIMQLPGRGPMEMDGMMGGRMGQNAQPKDIRNEANDVGSESITVPAGTFTCEHYKAKDGSSDVWVAKEVPPYGLIKMQSKDQTMVLVKALTNVQDKITGTPMDMGQMMRGMGAPPQQ